MDRILFGDNQFFGINHMSEEKARAQAMKFKDNASIMRVLDFAYDIGIKTFMCTTHDRVAEIADVIRANPTRYPDFQFYPCMPYAHKYANSVGEVGIIETARRFASGSIVETFISGASSVATKDVDKLAHMLMDAEMKPFSGLKTPVVFMQNIVTDMLLGMNLHHMFATFARHVRRQYDAEPGFITMNLPLLIDALDEAGVENPIVCANINKIGFRMSGGIEAYRSVIRSKRCRTIAMSIFASGAIPPREAIEWICDVDGLDSLVFGASSAGNIQQSKELIERCWGPDNA